MSVKVIIEDSHQDWIRISRVWADGTPEFIYEGHPGDVELDWLLRKVAVDIEVETKEWEKEDAPEQENTLQALERARAWKQP